MHLESFGKSAAGAFAQQGNLPRPQIEYSKFGPGLERAIEAASEMDRFSIGVSITSPQALSSAQQSLLAGAGLLIDKTEGTTTFAHITADSDLARLSNFEFVSRIHYLATEIEC